MINEIYLFSVLLISLNACAPQPGRNGFQRLGSTLQEISRALDPSYNSCLNAGYIEHTPEFSYCVTQIQEANRNQQRANTYNSSYPIPLNCSSYGSGNNITMHCM